jgi:hypothetical protein
MSTSRAEPPRSGGGLTELLELLGDEGQAMRLKSP